MELLDVKLVPHGLLCPPPQLYDLHLPYLVPHSLSRQCHIPVHLPHNGLIAGCRVLQHVLHGLLHAPPHCVYARVHHQATGTVYFHTEEAIP